MLFKNEAKRRMLEGGVCVTTGLNFHSPDLTELLLGCGADAISLDAEHGTLNEAEIVSLTRVCDLAAIPVFCRVPSPDPAFIQRILDGGVLGVVVPHVSDAATAEAVVAAIKYPPLGTRGLGNFTRATGFGKIPAVEYIAAANRETMVTVQIEDRAGVDNVESIAATEGVDCIWIGYNDLAVSLGYPGRAGEKPVQDAIDHVIAATRAAGRLVQVVSDFAGAERWVARGASLLSVGWTSYLSGAFREAIGRARSLREPPSQ